MEKCCAFLICLLLPLVSNGQKAPGCVYDNIHYSVGSQFDMGCSARCSCVNREGGIACVSMCPPRIYPPECRVIKPAGECCERGDCNVTEACEPFNAAVSYQNLTSAPWTVKIEIGENGNRKCSATLISRWKLITTPECISKMEPVSFVSQRQNLQVASVAKKDNFPYSLLKLASPLDYLKSLHEINLPWPHTCSDNNCALWLTSVSQSKVNYIQAKKADPSKCGLSETNQLACLEINNYADGCLNLDQASVLIKKGQNYYLIGLLSGGPSKKQPNNSDCDADRPRYRKYVNLCHQTNNMIETEWLSSFMEN